MIHPMENDRGSRYSKSERHQTSLWSPWTNISIIAGFRPARSAITLLEEPTEHLRVRKHWNLPGIHNDQMSYQDLRPREGPAIWGRTRIFPTRSTLRSRQYSQTSFFDCLIFDCLILRIIHSIWICFNISFSVMLIIVGRWACTTWSLESMNMLMHLDRKSPSFSMVNRWNCRTKSAFLNFSE